jgi:hypothetical protein
MRHSRKFLGRLGLALVLAAAMPAVSRASAPQAPAAQPAAVHTNPLHNDPLVKEAFVHFYDLDYAGAVERFERFHAQHPGDPQPAALLLESLVFQELYRQDLLDTTFYANDGFLTGRHATQEDPKVRDRILGLADEAIRDAGP